MLSAFRANSALLTVQALYIYDFISRKKNFRFFFIYEASLQSFFDIFLIFSLQYVESKKLVGTLLKLGIKFLIQCEIFFFCIVPKFININMK